MYKQGNARGTGEVRRGTSSIHFHCPVPRSSSHIGHGWTQTFCSQTFRAPPWYPGKILGYPAQKVWFPWFRGTYRTLWPPPLHVEDPYPTRKYPDPKISVWVPFSFQKLEWQIEVRLTKVPTRGKDWLTHVKQKIRKKLRGNARRFGEWVYQAAFFFQF